MSQTEVIVIVCVIAGVLVMGCVGLTLVGLLLPALGKARGEAKRLKDATQIKQIHQSLIVPSRQHDGIFPTPGLIDRLPFEGEDVPGRGAEDLLANDHAALYSALIMANFISPELCIGPTEPSGRVLVKEDYDWSVYSPQDDVYWDATFQVNLGRTSNASYAVLPVVGDRKKSEWRETMNSMFAVIGNRGVKNGIDEGAEYDRSITLQIHGGRRQWAGNICFNDNHVDFCSTFTLPGITYLDEARNKQPDNLFRNDTGGIDSAEGHDIWLTLIDSLTGDPESPTVSTQWD